MACLTNSLLDEKQAWPLLKQQVLVVLHERIDDVGKDVTDFSGKSLVRHLAEEPLAHGKRGLRQQMINHATYPTS